MLAAAALVLTSCDDFLTIYPTDKTVDNDFWKTKSDVEGMVTGAYHNMITGGIQERAIIWGAFRSDELVKLSSFSSTSLDYINAVNLLPSNGYNSWGDFYSVINRCNIVLRKAAGVMDLDPSFTQGDYDEACAQMKALRALCYFYLVRAFRDVPYTTDGTMADNEVVAMPQSTPDSVLQYCINDLVEAEPYIRKSGSYGTSDWRNVGYITRDAVYAILSDIYLWRASMTHSQADYQQCIDYADKVIQSKDSYYTSNTGTQVTIGDDDQFHLYEAQTALLQNFVTGNSRESILEWQYDGTNNSNEQLCRYYYKDNKDASTPILEASQLFNSVDENASNASGTKFYQTRDDYRYWNFVYEVNNAEATQLPVRKFVNNDAIVMSTTSTSGATRSTARTYQNYQQNWIVYRLPDIMLMKAEALVQTAATDSDATVLRQAFNLVQKVNKRALAENSKDTLVYENFNSKEDMERLVLTERERELCFEGKRWFDLVRYCYRHMTGVDIHSLMADHTEWPSLYTPMLRMVARKYTSGGDAFQYKMKSEPYLYFPISRGQIQANPLLRQNPVFLETESTSKN